LDFSFPRFSHEYALVFAVALPVVVILGINAALWLSGERGTLMMPSAKPIPHVVMPTVAVPAEQLANALSLAANLAPAMRQRAESARRNGVERRLGGSDRRVAVAGRDRRLATA
jgi:hypothetical protein